MAAITLKGNPIHTCGELPAVGAPAPAFADLVKTDLSAVALQDLRGKTVVLNIFPSVDTPTCAASVRAFNARAAKLPGAVVLCISEDLPFAHKRFCAAEGIEGVESVSAFRSPGFGRDYGVTLTDGPLRGLLARAVVVIDPAGTVAYTQLVPEIAQEPDYTAALAAI